MECDVGTVDGPAEWSRGAAAESWNVLGECADCSANVQRSFVILGIGGIGGGIGCFVGI